MIAPTAYKAAITKDIRAAIISATMAKMTVAAFPAIYVTADVAITTTIVTTVIVTATATTAITIIAIIVKISVANVPMV